LLLLFVKFLCMYHRSSDLMFDTNQRYSCSKTDAWTEDDDECR
jgi:hypothetical protein